jgi:hypothetical protein
LEKKTSYEDLVPPAEIMEIDLAGGGAAEAAAKP